jgi:hypothetical protein
MSRILTRCLMKYLLLSSVCWLFLCLSTSAQHKVVTINDLSRKTVHFDKPDAQRFSGLFRHFEVIDERPDTGRIGISLLIGTIRGNYDRQFVFDKPAAAEISDYLNRYCTRPDAPFTALVVLRGLWLSNSNYLGPDGLKSAETQYEQWHIRLKAEIYAKRDSLYIPIFRYDTAWSKKMDDYTSAQHASFSELEANLSNLFLNLADSASSVTEQKQNSSRPITRQQIDDFNRSRFDKFADTNTTCARGVYANFEEFINNAPSIQDFEIKMEKKDHLLYIKDAAGKTNFSADAWGYCDGKSLFIMRDGILWPVWKEEKAFYFYALSDKEINMPQTFSALGQPIYNPKARESLEKEICIYTLDTDTGEIY